MVLADRAEEVLRRLTLRMDDDEPPRTQGAVLVVRVEALLRRLYAVLGR